jgi:GNAT superfamily N-acetyltransferase
MKWSEKRVRVRRRTLARLGRTSLPEAELTAVTGDAEARRVSPSDQRGVIVTVRPVASVEELLQLAQVIAAQFPPRRAASADAATPEAHFEKNRSLKLLAERNGTIVGGALAFRAGDAVQVDVIALTLEARGLGIGRKLMEASESEAIRLGAQSIFLGGASSENRGFYWRLGFAGRGSLMHKGLPLSSRLMAERRRRALTAGHSAAT